MVFKEVIDQTGILVKKISRLPAHQLWHRVYLGLKKQVTNYPQYVTLQTASACNLQCAHCFINDYKTEIKDGVIKIMKFDEFLRFAGRLDAIIRNAEYFSFSTFEALLNKHLFQMMDHLLSLNPNIKFPLLSNAMLMTDEVIAKLEGYPISDLTISMDGMTKEVVEDFKTGVDFDALVDALRRLNQSQLRDKVVLTFVAHKNNIHQLPDYMDFVHGLGIKNILVSNILTFTPKTAHLALYTKEGNKEVEALFGEAIIRARKNKQILQLPLLKPQIKGCQAVEMFFIDSNGNVAPCDFLAVTTPFTLFGETTRSAPVVMGNVLYDDPVEIYRSERYQSFRMAHRLGKELPEPCRNCIDGFGLMCSNRTVYK